MLPGDNFDGGCIWQPRTPTVVAPAGGASNAVLRCTPEPAPDTLMPTTREQDTSRTARNRRIAGLRHIAILPVVFCHQTQIQCPVHGPTVCASVTAVHHARLRALRLMLHRPPGCIRWCCESRTNRLAGCPRALLPVHYRTPNKPVRDADKHDRNGPSWYRHDVAIIRQTFLPWSGPASVHAAGGQRRSGRTF